MRWIICGVVGAVIVGALFETHRLSWAAASAPTLGWKAIHAARSVRLYLQADPSVGGILLATLPGNATSYQFQKLTPGVTAFIRIEAETAGGVVSQNLSIQTPGGPGAVLDSPVREIHAYAPDILRVVLSGGNGSTWQAGPWSITRANGAKIAVREVHRESIPVGGPDYQVGYGRPYRDDVLDIEHRIYLVLAEPIGNIEILNIHGPKSIDLMLPFNDRFLETPVIQLNQVGYDPHATQRFAYVSGWMGDGGTLPLTNFPTEAEVLEDNGSRATVVAAVPVTTRSKFDPEVGGEVRQIDLSAVAPSEGRRLRVRLPGVGISWPTSVGESAISQTFSILARGLFLNRWGGDLKPRFTEWSRPADYHAVYTGELADFKQMYPASMPRTGERRVTAGYHDAGDFEQRPMSTVVAQLLMRAFELGSHSFADGQLNIPESGNGIPDLLDEALWGVSFWEQLQESDGGVRQGVQSHRHPWGFYLASDDPLPYWTFSRDANVTARAAGLFAQAARLVSPYDRARSAELKQRAVRAWNYADASGAANSYRLYGAGELYHLTQEQIYKDAFERAWHAIGAYGAFSDFAPYQLAMDDYANGRRSMADFIQGYLEEAVVSADVKKAALAWLTKYADESVKTIDSVHAYRNPRPERYPMDWGQGTTMGRWLDTVIARLQMGGLSAQQKQRYLDVLSLAADYILGGNPNGLVYITGLGSRHVREPLHLDSLVFIKQGKGAMPGIPVFGPTLKAPKEPYTLPTIAAFYPPFDQRPEALRYADVRTIPNFNEFSVWETQAPNVELFGVLFGLR